MFALNSFAKLDAGQPVNWAHPLNRGLVSWWLASPLGHPSYSGGSRWLDLCRRHHGTLTNGPTWQGSRGRPGGHGCLDFDGSNDRLDCGDFSVIDLPNFAVSFWIRPDTIGSYNTVYNKATASEMSFYLQSSTVVLWYIQAGGPSVTLPSTLVAGQWVHFVLTRDSANDVRLYMNGALINTTNRSHSMTTAGNLIWGFDSSGGGTLFDGQMDDMRIWRNRTLSDGDVKQLVDLSRRGNPGLLNLVPTRLAARTGLITFVGSASNAAINGADVTITLPTLLEGDVVYVAGGFARTGTNPSISTAGYTELARFEATFNFGVWRKVMGAVPDTTVTGKGSANVADAAAYVAVCLRGVDQTTPEDVPTETNDGISANPDGPSITTVTNHAWVLSFAGGNVFDATVTAPTGYSNQVDESADDSRDATVGGATKLVTSAGTENPPAWTSWSSSDWCTVTVAVRPATGAGPETYTGTAAVTVGAATASGSATHDPPTFTASAAVSVGAATASGTATFPFIGDAAVTTGAATCSGSATHDPPVFEATSAITVGAATASGSATFGPPTFEGAAAVSAGAATASGSAEFSAPVYAGTSAVIVGAATAAGSAEFVAPTYAGAAAVSAGPATVVVSASFAAPVYEGAAAVIAGAAVASGSATFELIFSGVATVTVGATVAAGIASFVAPVYTASAAVIVGAAAVGGVAVLTVSGAGGRVVFATVHCPGAAELEFFSPGAVEGQVFSPGAADLEVTS